MIHLSTVLVSIVLGTLVPLGTTALTKVTAPAWLKAALGAALSTAGGAVTVASANGGNMAWQATLGTIALTMCTAVVTHYLPGARTAVAQKTAKFGIGG